MDVLISGLNSYVGRRSVSLMGDSSFRVYAVTRGATLFKSAFPEPINATFYRADLMRADFDEEVQLPELGASYYFSQVPSLDDFLSLRLELLSLRNFAELLRRNNCKRIIYVASILDKHCIQPVVDLLNELALDYTVVLSSYVVGKGSSIDRLFKRLSSRKIAVTVRAFSNKIFEPIGIADFLNWLKAILEVPAFHGRIIEVGGGEKISFGCLFGMYQQLHIVKAVSKIFYVPTFIFKTVYRTKFGLLNRDYPDVRRFLDFDDVVDDTWKACMSYSFQPLEKTLLADQ